MNAKAFFFLKHATQQTTKLQFKHRFIGTIFRDTNTTHIYNKQNIWGKKALGAVWTTGHSFTPLHHHGFQINR